MQPDLLEEQMASSADEPAVSLPEGVPPEINAKYVEALLNCTPGFRKMLTRTGKIKARQDAYRSWYWYQSRSVAEYAAELDYTLDWTVVTG